MTSRNGAGQVWNEDTGLWHVLDPAQSLRRAQSLIVELRARGAISRTLTARCSTRRFALGDNYELSFLALVRRPIYGADGLLRHPGAQPVESGPGRDVDYIGTGGALGPGQDAIQSGWFQERYDLKPPPGRRTGLSAVLPSRAMATAKEGEGFYLDDIRIGPKSLFPADSLPVSIPSRGLLTPNFPNPFSRSTSIAFGLNAARRVSLGVYSVDGRLVHRLATGSFGPGYHITAWSGDDAAGRKVPSGVYICRLFVEDAGPTSVFQRKLVLLRH